MQGDRVKEPLYYQLVKNLAEQIKTEMQVNDKLASEKEIGLQYAVSRTTVRLALAELEQRGYIYRIQGKGSFVSARQTHLANSFFELAPQLETDNITDEFEIKLLGLWKEKPSSKIIQLMNVTSGQSVLRLTTLIALRQQPVLIDTFLINSDNAKPLTEDNLKSKPYQGLTDYLAPIRSADETYTVRVPVSEEIKQLEVSETEPLLVLSKHYYDESNRMTLINERIVVPSRYRYQNFISMSDLN